MGRKTIALLVPILIFLLALQVYANTAGPRSAYPSEFEFTHNGIEAEAVEGRCTSCHNAPISRDCIDCHTELPLYIDNVFFPHHNITQPAGDIGCSDSRCHDAHPDDVRFVVKPDPGHNYCSNCHEISHAGGGEA